MTLAPQSPSCRTQVGPERTRVRSRTVNRERAWEALGNSISMAPECLTWSQGRNVGPTFPDLPGLVHRSKRIGRTHFLFIILRNIGSKCLEKDIAGCHITGGWKTRLRVAGCVHETSLKRISPRLLRHSK